MNYSPIVEYRKPQPAPTEPGWYYGRITPDEPIRPVRVRVTYDGSNILVAVHINGTADVLGYYEWFGPVTEVREG